MHLVRSMAAAFAMVAALASQAAADVSCADPNDLCTGDPCTITTVSVQSPCVVDFGARTLIIAGTVSVPDDGTLSFTAATIIQRGPIDGRHVGHGSDALRRPNSRQAQSRQRRPKEGQDQRYNLARIPVT